MIKIYFKDLFQRFKAKKPIIKVLFGLLLIIEIFFVVVSVIKTDYIVYTPGSLTSATKTVSIDTTNSSGSIYTVSVFSYDNISLLQYWLSKNDKKLLVEDPKDNILDYESENKYGVVCKRVSINNSLMYAYNKAKEKDPNINLVSIYKGAIVAAIIDNPNSDLQPDDIITHVNDVKITSVENLKEELGKIIGKTKFDGDLIEFTCIKVDNDNPVKKSIKILKNEDNTLELLLNSAFIPSLGIILYDYYFLDGQNSNPKFTIEYNTQTDASGNSGGAMNTLSIYNRLLEEDVTYGNIVCGTGTINTDGTLGQIGGVEQKITKAKLSGAKIFFVDEGDYDDAIKACELYGYDSSFVYKVSTFDEILETLKNINSTNGGK